MEERGEGTLSGRGTVRMEEGGGEGKIEREREEVTDNGVLRRLVFLDIE